MPHPIANQLVTSIKRAQHTLANLSVAEKHALEKHWDIEHAYYSSALEGSQIDRQEFEKLGEQVK